RLADSVGEISTDNFKYLWLGLISQNGRGGATEILAVVYRANTGRNAELDIRHLPLAAFTADLAHGFEHVQHAAGRRWLAAVDHAAAGLNRQIAFEGEVGFFEECLIVFAAEAEIFDLEHDDGNVVVVEIETANILV